MQKFISTTEKNNIYKNFDAVYSSNDEHLKGYSWREEYEGEFGREIRDTLKLTHYMTEKVVGVINELIEILDVGEIGSHVRRDGILYEYSTVVEPFEDKTTYHTYSEKLLGFVDVAPQWESEPKNSAIVGFHIYNAFGHIVYQTIGVCRQEEFLFKKS